jgi:succinoglycan biosynthesis transport protein ExoP
MRDLVGHALERYEFIIFDLPSLVPFADVRAASQILDSCLVVVEWGRTQAAAVEDGIRASGLRGDRLLGVLLNKVNLRVLKTYVSTE